MDDNAVFRRVMDRCPPKSPSLYVMNHWQVKADDIPILDCDEVEKWYGVRPEMVTSLGQQPVEEQDASFHRFLDFMLKRVGI